MNLTNVIQILAGELELSLQNMQPHHPLYGAYISPEHGLDEAGHVGTTRLIVRCGYVALAQAHGLIDASNQAELLERMELAADYLLRVQRSSGLIDLRNTNYESGPDTAFALQLIGGLIELTRSEPAFSSVIAKLETFARRATLGVMTSGFHTPNHRWVIAGALALSGALFPDIETRPVVDLYLAEGIDCDAEGAYLERSIGVYDAVTNRSLMLIAEHLGDAALAADLLEKVVRNLDFDVHFLHADGTAETGLSTRQDYGQRVIPTPLIAPYLQAGIILGKQEFIAAANYLWERGQGKIQDLEWQGYVLFKYGDPPPMDAAIPADYTRFYPLNRVWRSRQPGVSASVFGGRTRLLHLVYRSAELVSLKIAQAYFGVGLFIADEMEQDEGDLLLRSSGRQKLTLPAYYRPLGRPVAPEHFEASKLERELVDIPPAESILKITPVAEGFDLHYRTLDGLDDVIAQIALDFPAGGLWETDDSAVVCQPGTILFLKQGAGRMRFGTDVIEISPGAFAHLTTAMRHSEPPEAGQVRVLLTFVTPVDHRFSIRTRQQL